MLMQIELDLLLIVEGLQFIFKEVSGRKSSANRSIVDVNRSLNWKVRFEWTNIRRIYKYFSIERNLKYMDMEDLQELK